MELKWIALASIAVALLLIYARAMRLNAHASWLEILSFGIGVRQKKPEDKKAST